MQLSIRLLIASLWLLTVSPAFASQVQSGNSPSQTSAVEVLASQGFEIGDVVDFVPDFQLKGWKYVDPRYMTVLGAESRRYLVSLQKCYGLNLPSSFLIPKTSKSDRLAKNDTFLVKNRGMTVAHCDVKAVYELNKLDQSAVINA
jgi:hypothetical protein